MILVLLCSYNGERYIREQLDSILSQKTEEEFQLLVSDDASTDATREILSEYAAEYPEKLRLIFRERPSGSPWKHFLSLFAEGYGKEAEYVMLSDQDDVWKAEKLEKTLEKMRALEKESGGRELPLLVHCDSSLTDEALRPLAPSFVKYQRMSPERTALPQLLVQNNVVGGALMVNQALSSLVREVPEQAVMHDQWLALLAAAFGRISFLPEPLYLYRQHGSNVLGAEKGSFFGEVLGRLGIGRRDGRSRKEMDAQSANAYRGLFLQAESFLRLYESELSEKQRRLLRAFLSIPGRSRIGKAGVILRYGFTFNLPHRTLGELLFI